MRKCNLFFINLVYYIIIFIKKFICECDYKIDLKKKEIKGVINFFFLKKYKNLFRVIASI